MVFSDHTYSVLVVSANEKFNNAVTGLLPVNYYYPVVFVKSIEAARRLFFDKSFEIVIINTPLPDEFGSRFACDVCDQSESGVLLLVGSDLYDEIYYKTIEHGVMSLQKPLSESSLRQALNIVCATIERMKRFAKKQDTVNDKIEEMRIVNRAKWMLIDHAHMTEPDAHRFIEKKAMDDRTSKKLVAERIIKQYDPAAQSK